MRTATAQCGIPRLLNTPADQTAAYYLTIQVLSTINSKFEGLDKKNEKNDSEAAGWV